MEFKEPSEAKTIVPHENIRHLDDSDHDGTKDMMNDAEVERI
jgi:hypothetical protein